MSSVPVLILGADVVDWLYTHVEGFKDRREARKYASSMLKHGYLRHTVNKITFSEQCYYVFGDLCGSKFPGREGQGHTCAVSSVLVGGTEQSPVGQGEVGMSCYTSNYTAWEGRLDSPGRDCTGARGSRLDSWWCDRLPACQSRSVCKL